MTGGFAQLLIRADGSSAMGLGHVMRTLAFAEEARARGIEVSYVTSRDAVAVKLPAERGFRVIEVDDPSSTTWLEELGTDTVVLMDGYGFPRELMEGVARAGVSLVVMDLIPGSEVAQLIIAPDVAVAPLVSHERTRILLGNDYVPIRREFLRERRLRYKETKTLLVTMGGSDPEGLTEAVVTAAADSRGAFEVVLVVLGPAAGAGGLRNLPGVEIQVAPQNVAQVFGRASAAISAAGNTAHELLAMGVPTALVEVNHTQADVGRWVEATGAALRLGRGRAALPKVPWAVAQLSQKGLRRQLSQRALGLVDGHGAKRVVDALMDLGNYRPRT